MNDDTLYLGTNVKDAKAVCVFVHGRGQSPEMMQEHVISRLALPHIAYILPRAKNGSWYTARAIDALTELTRGQLAASLDQIQNAMKNQKVPIMLAGFSQGACVVIEYAMKFGPWKGALASFTGCRVGVETDDRPQADLNGMPVYLTGADADPWIPVNALAQAAGDLSKSRARLRIESFPNRPHEVNDAEIFAFNEMLSCLGKGQPIWKIA
jgi:phospholipase/carboxylesterase